MLIIFHHQDVKRNHNEKKLLPLYEDMSGHGGITPQFLIFALARGQWSASCPGRFSSWGNTPSPPMPINHNTKTANK
jgi:hypothetical protein